MIATLVVPRVRAVLLDALALHDRRRYRTRSLLPTLIQGIGMAGLLYSARVDHAVRACRATGFRRPRACRTSCGSCAAASARRSFQTAWDHRSIMHHAQLTERANAYNPVFDQSIRQMGAAGFSQPQAYGLFNSMATQQAAQLGVNDLFFVSAGIFVALIALIWITKPERAGGDAARLLRRRIDLGVDPERRDLQRRGCFITVLPFYCSGAISSIELPGERRI